MMRSALASALLVGLLAHGAAQAAPLITAKEASLPPAAGTLATRGISRGPANLTSRLQPSITPTGIDFQQAEVPPGEHTLRVTVKDSAGRETNSTMTIVVNK